MTLISRWFYCFNIAWPYSSSIALILCTAWAFLMCFLVSSAFIWAMSQGRMDGQLNAIKIISFGGLITVMLCHVTVGGAMDKVKFFVSWPILVLLFFTIPNCAKPRWERFFMLSFFLSTLWIAIFSYVMVWMVSFSIFWVCKHFSCIFLLTLFNLLNILNNELC